LISSILKQALVNIAVDTHLPKYTEPTSRNEWADLMHRLGVKVVHIAERDTQVTKEPKKHREFVNTWSADGFISEGIFQSAELGWGTHEKELPEDALEHTTGSRAAIYLKRPGAATRVRTWTPIEQNFNGFLVTHNESISIAEYFSVKNGDKVVFRPTVHYAYHPADIAVTSVDELLGKDSVKPDPSLIRVAMDDIVSGHDELGVLVMGHPKVTYWFGSIMDVHSARKLAPYNNATSLQVAAGVLAGVVHCLENQKDGVIEAEDLDYKRAIEVATPYLGEIVGKYSDWTPIKNFTNLFPRPVDLKDPWQFKNFRVF
jgi:homospermidine synthase